MPAPAPAFIGLIDEINARFSEGPISEFEIAMYAKRATAILDVHPAPAHCVLGMLACIAGNEEEMHKNHKASLALSNDPVFLFNYGCSLQTMEMHQEALDYFHKAVGKSPAVLRYLNKAIDTAFFLDHASLFDLLNRWTKLSKGEEHPIRLEIESRDLTRFCMGASEKSLEEVWGGAKEAEAWAHLQ